MLTLVLIQKNTICRNYVFDAYIQKKGAEKLQARDQ
jgi:hypothetical protein